jgi:hypothetical protein
MELDANTEQSVFGSGIDHKRQWAPPITPAIKDRLPGTPEEGVAPVQADESDAEN